MKPQSLRVVHCTAAVTRALASRSPHSVRGERQRQDRSAGVGTTAAQWGRAGCFPAASALRPPPAVSGANEHRPRGPPPRPVNGGQQDAVQAGAEGGASSPPKRRLLQVPASFSTPRPTATPRRGPPEDTYTTHTGPGPRVRGTPSFSPLTPYVLSGSQVTLLWRYDT